MGVFLEKTVKKISLRKNCKQIVNRDWKIKNVLYFCYNRKQLSKLFACDYSKRRIILQALPICYYNTNNG